METELSTPRTRRESEVWQACDDLWAQSAQARHLTGDNIRDHLIKLGYKRGSPNEIYRYRTSWRESRGISEQGEEATEEVQSSDPISRAVSMVYDQMRTQTNEALDKLTEDYETKVKVTLIEIASLKDELVKLGAEKSAFEREFVAAQQRNTELDIALAKEQHDQIALVERLKGAKEQLEGIRSEHERLILELKTFHEREIDLWRSQVSDAQKALTETKREAKSETDRLGAQFSDELMKLKTELRQTNEEKTQATFKLDATEEALKEARARALGVDEERKVYIHEVSRLSAERDSAMRALESQKAELAKWQGIVEQYFDSSTRSLRARDAKELRWM